MKICKTLLITLLALILVMALFACNPVDDDPVVPDSGDIGGGTGGGGDDDDDDDGGFTGPEYELPMEEGMNQITFYINFKGDTSDCDMWIWWDGKEGSGYLMHPCAYGAKVVVNVPEGITQVGFIVRKDCSEPGGNAWGNATKDVEVDRFAVIEGDETFVWLKSGDQNQYISSDGGKTLEIRKSFTMAGMVSFNQVKYTINPRKRIESLDQVKLYDGDREIEITNLSSLNNSVISGTLTVAETLDLTKTYVLEIEDYGQKAVMPTDIFDSEEFIENYTYDGDDLGAYVHGDSTVFKLWAPTASKVVLNLFTAGDGGEAFKKIEMTKVDKGVWEHTEAGVGHGTYYTYSVTTAMGTQEAVDPYAKSAGVNGNRGMVLDFDLTDPTGFGLDTYVNSIDSYTDAIIWEVHVRDFSNKIATSQYKGKYMAFTETGLTNSHGISVGVDYVKNLGITHVHLLPVYDYQTVDEANPDSGFNWGYDPKNYNVPEGSYSTDPFNGEVRVNEFKQMVMGLHNQGLGVVMDVVYNHTYDGNSSLNKIVPYYYYRYTASGENSNGSGCGNETASNRYMFSKFMVDSVVYWATEYHVDGFRFDLMALHDIETMQKIEQALHAINPNAIIYGEGWTGGTSALSGNKQATQANIKQITVSDGAAGGVAVFNDVIRDGLKGSVFEHTGKGYINGAATSINLSKVKFGIRGGTAPSPSGWTVNNAAIINYVSAHDNHTLWDKLEISCPENTVEERLAMNRLAAAVVMLSQGTPFMQAGEEMLRTKGGDENSYKSPDSVNNIDWESLTPDSEAYKMYQYYQGLIAVRKASDALTANGGVEITFVDLPGYALAVKFVGANGEEIVAVINPTSSAVSYGVEGEYTIYAQGDTASATALGTLTGNFNVEARTVTILVKNAD